MARSAVLERGLVTAAATSYAANCALGTSVATGLLDTRDYRWLHHALYLATSALTGAAVVALVARRHPGGWTLLPTLLPLAALPRASARTPRHARLGLSAAPFYLATLRRAWR
ncbi:MAG TPA: hypothetical protein VK401_02070 [Propionibacteriaceae bacterium]|jgi:hypothetical protein|nr:hypothetical protein [Propionibacteriaceae bacterium]